MAFAQCDVAVIHGGAGTIAAVLRAKIPMVITSVFGDQPWWGSMIQNKKLGIHLPFKKLSTRLLLEAISKVRSTQIRKNAFEIGEKMSKENGVKAAIEAINKYFEIK